MVWFVGAGPGAADLITVRGMEKLQQADVVIYAGSLVSEEHLKYCKKDAEIYDSAAMDFNEVIRVISEAEAAGKMTVRLHTGDPSIYGTIREQGDELNRRNIPWETVPGVSSFLAAAARVGAEFTVPGVSQTVIITRLEGRTGTGEGGKLEELAKHRASMSIFLSVQNIDGVVAKLRTGYEEDTPIAVVYKATWPDEKIIRGTLKDIGEKVKANGVDRFAQILVGDFLAPEYEMSKLYDPGFTHMYRVAGENGGKK